MTDATQNKMVWPPKQNKHPKGARLPKGQRTHEAVEYLWSQVRDTSLPDWARRSALLYLVRSARTHWELMVAARGFRDEPWFTHFTKSGIHAGDHSAWVDQLAAARAVDLGWPLEKWVRVWAVIMLAPAPTSSWRAACEGDYTGLMPRMQALLSAPPPRGTPAPDEVECRRTHHPPLDRPQVSGGLRPLRGVFTFLAYLGPIRGEGTPPPPEPTL